MRFLSAPFSGNAEPGIKVSVTECLNTRVFLPTELPVVQLYDKNIFWLEITYVVFGAISHQQESNKQQGCKGIEVNFVHRSAGMVEPFHILK